MNPETLLLLVVLVILVLAGSRGGFRSRRLPAMVRPVVESGALYIFFGALIGPQGANLFTTEILTQLSPVIVICLGWIGFLYGSHFEWRLIRRYPISIYAAGFLEAFISFAVVAIPALWLLTSNAEAGLLWPDRVAAALILGICASGTAPAGTFQISGRWGISHSNLNVLRLYSAIDDLPGIVILGLLGAFLHPAMGDKSQIWSLVWLVYSVGMGIGTGMIAHWIFPRGEDVRHNSLILLGVVSLAAGSAMVLGLSPLFVTTLAGMTFANFSSRKESAYGLLAEREHSLYAVFLLVAGVLFQFDWAAIFLLVPFYLVFRSVGKLAGGYLGWLFFLDRERISPMIGSGLLFQGGMALAMAVSFDRTHGSALAHQVTTTIVVAVLMNEVLGPVIARSVLGRWGTQ